MTRLEGVVLEEVVLGAVLGAGGGVGAVLEGVVLEGVVLEVVTLMLYNCYNRTKFAGNRK